MQDLEEERMCLNCSRRIKKIKVGMKDITWTHLRLLDCVKPEPAPECSNCYCCEQIKERKGKELKNYGTKMCFHCLHDIKHHYPIREDVMPLQAYAQGQEKTYEK